MTARPRGVPAMDPAEVARADRRRFLMFRTMLVLLALPPVAAVVYGIDFRMAEHPGVAKLVEFGEYTGIFGLLMLVIALMVAMFVYALWAALSLAFAYALARVVHGAGRAKPKRPRASQPPPLPVASPDDGAPTLQEWMDARRRADERARRTDTP